MFQDIQDNQIWILRLELFETILSHPEKSSLSCFILPSLLFAV